MQLSAQHLAEIVETVRKIEKGAGSDKRRFARFEVSAKVEVLNHTTNRTYTALTRDLSLEGIGLIQSVSMSRGEQISISLPRGKGGPLVTQCTVMHARELADGIWGIGALFVSAVPQMPAPTQAAASGDSNEAQRIAAKMLG